MDILSRLGLNSTGPFSETLDEVLRGIIKQFGLEDDLEKVSGDNEKLTEAAGDYRQAARDLRGVVSDLEAERKALLKAWKGEAADAFRKKSLAFEAALKGEAGDLDTIATLLEEAAEACAMAEQLMIDLIVEIVEAALAAAATAAILAIITAGAAAVIGPLITAASIAHRALKAVRITSDLADKLSDIARRLQAIRRAEKLASELKNLGAGKKHDKTAYRMGWERHQGRVADVEGGNPADVAQFAALRDEERHRRGGHRSAGRGRGHGRARREAVRGVRPQWRARRGPEGTDGVRPAARVPEFRRADGRQRDGRPAEGSAGLRMTPAGA